MGDTETLAERKERLLAGESEWCLLPFTNVAAGSDGAALLSLADDGMFEISRQSNGIVHFAFTKKGRIARAMLIDA